MTTKFDNDDFYFYYLRREDNTPFGCVALRKDSENKWSRGISLCSDMDVFEKEEAKKRAKSRCIRALFAKDSSELIKAKDKSVVAEFLMAWCPQFKSAYDVVLTEKEEPITKKNDKPLFQRS